MIKYSIENGYFIFTMMPSLHCNLKCPHCYLSEEQRADTTILSSESVKIACEKVNDYYNKNNIKDKKIIAYWYGGEPTDMGIDYFLETVSKMNSIFSKENGYTFRHVVLSSLNTMKKDWYPILYSCSNGYLQTSYDGMMRGSGYVKKWERKVKEVISYGFKLATLTVVNNEILKDGPKKTLDYLCDLGITETSWLPFMWNEQNNGDKYDTLAPSMNEYSDFMIALSEEYLDKKRKGIKVPKIGQLEFILSQGVSGNLLSNIAAQTLFLLPNGDFVLPDYRNEYQEYMKVFGNILTQDFDQILRGKERSSYLRRQVTRNNNKECMSCEHADKCIMEFWKDNRENDDCFGAKRYVEWVIKNKPSLSDGSHSTLF
jgi:sulfatase maturation enzyme AslB (radical SAM superfamily)